MYLVHCGTAFVRVRCQGAVPKHQLPICQQLDATPDGNDILEMSWLQRVAPQSYPHRLLSRHDWGWMR